MTESDGKMSVEEEFKYANIPISDSEEDRYIFFDILTNSNIEDEWMHNLLKHVEASNEWLITTDNPKRMRYNNAVALQSTLGFSQDFLSDLNVFNRVNLDDFLLLNEYFGLDTQHIVQKPVKLSQGTVFLNYKDFKQLGDINECLILSPFTITIKSNRQLT